MRTVYCFGNSHVWTLVGGTGQNDTRILLVDGDLELVGYKLGKSGATAYGLLSADSDSGAGTKIPAILDGIPGNKDVLLVFGEVDVTEHLGKHGQSVTDDVRTTVARYEEYLRTLHARKDVGLVLVTSTIPHSHHFRGTGPEHEGLKSSSVAWNRAVEDMCDRAGLEYVDWYDCVDTAFGSPADGEVDDVGEANPNESEERHMGPACRPILVNSVRAALFRLDS